MKNIIDFIYESANYITVEDLFELIKKDWEEGEKEYHDLKPNWENKLKKYILRHGSKFSEASDSDSDSLGDKYEGNNGLDLSKSEDDPTEYGIAAILRLGNKKFIGFGLNNGNWDSLTWYECYK